MMKQINPTQEIWDFFHPVEGLNIVYYGKVRNGKTRTATADILKLLQRGEIVYANWKINFADYDERTNFWLVFVKWLRGRKYYFKYSHENLHFINPDELISGKGELNIKYLSRLVGVHLFIDEGQWVLPALDRSFDDEVIDKMRLVLHGGHYCRSLNIITQRPANLTKTTRSQINVWYRCVKVWQMFGWILFKKYAIEDMKEDLPIEFESRPPVVEVGFFGRMIGREEAKQIPLGKMSRYWAHIKTDPVFAAYDTHGMRAADAIESLPAFEVYGSTRWQSFKLLLSLIWPWGGRRAAGDEIASPPPVQGDNEGNVPLPLDDAEMRQIEALDKPKKDFRVLNLKKLSN